MKRIVLVLLAVVLLAGMVSAPALADTAYVYITGNANVRTGPGKGYGSMGTANSGSFLPFMEDLARDDRGVIWYRVAFGANAGWVSGVYAVPQDRMLEVWCESGESYLRTAPNLNGKQVATISPDTCMEFTGGVSVDDRGVAWYSLNYRGNPDIWVSSKYTNVYLVRMSRCVTAVDGDTYLRALPNLDGRQLEVLHQGDSLMFGEECAVDERGVVWFSAYSGENTGWVSSRYAEVVG